MLRRAEDQGLHTCASIFSTPQMYKHNPWKNNWKLLQYNNAI